MTSDLERLRALEGVTRLLADQAVEPVLRCRALASQKQDQINTLAAHREELLRCTNDLTVAAPMLRQAGRLQSLQKQAQRDLTRIQAELEKLRAEAAHAIGRKAALKELIDQELAKENLVKARRKLR